MMCEADTDVSYGSIPFRTTFAHLDAYRMITF
jgi:hypothetical protein